MRPFMDPSNEPLTVILNGVTDSRFFRQQQTRQYSISAPLSNQNELVRLFIFHAALSNLFGI